MLRSKKGFIILSVLTLVIFGGLYFYFHSTGTTEIDDIPMIIVAIMAACAPAGLFTVGPAIIGFGAKLGGIFDASIGRFIGGFFGIIFGAGLGMIVVPICFLAGLVKLLTHGFDEKTQEEG